jgi:hypothetical protein
MSRARCLLAAVCLGAALAAGAALGACTGEDWQSLAAEEAPGPDDTVPAGVVHVVTARGLERLADGAWRTLSVRYADGLAAPIGVRHVRHEEAPLTVYGPGRVVARPAGVTLALRGEGEGAGVGAALLLGDVTASLTLQTWRTSGQELSCTARITLHGARYDFVVAPPPPAAQRARASAAASGGTLTEERAALTVEDCAFPLLPEQETNAIGRVRSALWDLLDAERDGKLGATLQGALAPRLELAAALAVPPGSGSAALGRLALATVVSDDLVPVGRGLATAYDVGVAASGPVCAPAEATAAPLSEDVVLPVREVGPDGAPYDEALVVSRPLLERALAAAQAAGLLGTRLAAGGADESGAAAALVALWPAEIPAEVARLSGDRFALRMRLSADPAAAGPFAELLPAPNEGGAAFAPLRLRIGRLRVDVHGAVDDVELRLFTLEARGVTVDLLPEADADGLVRLRVAALQTRHLESARGLLALPSPGAAWIKLLLDAALARQPFLDLGVLAAPPPVLAGTEWLQSAAWVLYLRRP